jgi:hypothetical protein
MARVPTLPREQGKVFTPANCLDQLPPLRAGEGWGGGSRVPHPRMLLAGRNGSPIRVRLAMGEEE